MNVRTKAFRSVYREEGDEEKLSREVEVWFQSLSNDANIVREVQMGDFYLFVYTDAERSPNGKPICKKCGREMAVRVSKEKGNFFWGCPGFPDCKGILSFTQEDHRNFGGYSDSRPSTPSVDGDIPF